MTDLHERILAELDRRETIAADAAAAETMWPFRPYGPGAVRLAPRERCIQHAALHDPADAARRYTHYRQILQRHRPIATETHLYCQPCGEDFHWPCAEIRDLATALGLTP